MDRLGSIVLVAGFGCFVLAGLLSGLYPYMITDGRVAEASIAELAEQVPAPFRELKQSWPTSFADFPGAELALTLEQLVGVPADDPRRAASEAAWSEAYAAALARGRDVYVSEGCWHCHSQYVRPVANEALRFGPVQLPDHDNNALQRPVLWGTRRVGPDLTHEGGLRSNDWHVAHFWDPTTVSPGSVMPRYRWLFRDGFEVRRRIDPVLAERTGLPLDRSYAFPGVHDTREQAEQALQQVAASLPPALAAEASRLFVAETTAPDTRALALIAYLQWLGTWTPPHLRPEAP